jgi:hypothetical protein
LVVALAVVMVVYSAFVKVVTMADMLDFWKAVLKVAWMAVWMVEK